MRFNSVTAYPPGGMYFYELEGRHVQSTSQPEISVMVKNLYRSLGRTPPFDPFALVMDHMCKSMPPGMCDGGAPAVASVNVAAVKANTRALFGKRPASPVVIRERLCVCLACKKNNRATCPSCSGLLPWILEGMGNRTRIPADDFAFVCEPALVFVSALATVEEPGPAPEGCPPGCWRLNP